MSMQHVATAKIKLLLKLQRFPPLNLKVHTHDDNSYY